MWSVFCVFAFIVCNQQHSRWHLKKKLIIWKINKTLNFRSLFSFSLLLFFLVHNFNKNIIKSPSKFLRIFVFLYTNMQASEYNTHAYRQHTRYMDHNDLPHSPAPHQPTVIHRIRVANRQMVWYVFNPLDWSGNAVLIHNIKFYGVVNAEHCSV